MLELPNLEIEIIWEILNNQIEDAIVNQLIWRSLGYRWDPEAGQWNTVQVAPDWRELYPEPPDFIASRPATVKLTRSIPQVHKQLLKEQLGFTGYKVGELVPRLTRRATAANWLLSCLQRNISTQASG